MNKNLNTWNKMWSLWSQCNVPEIKTRKFIIEDYSPHSPWFSLVFNEQYRSVENPQIQTAFHLSVYLRDKDPELVAAYKIFAYTKCYNFHHDFVFELSEAMNKFHKALYSWWNGNAKKVVL